MTSDSVKKDLQNLEHLGESGDSQFAAHILNCLDSKSVGKTTLSLSEYIKFWGELSEKNQVYNYALGLLTKFQAFDEMKKSKKAEVNIEFEMTYKAIGLTLLCLNLFWNLKSEDPKIEWQISQWFNDKPPSDSAKTILDLLKCAGDYNAMIERTLYEYLSLDELTTTINISTGDVDVDSQNFNFLSWLFLITCAYKRQGVYVLLEKLFTYIEQISKSLNEIETTGPKLLLVLDMYYDIYTFYPYVEPHYLSKLLQYIEPLQYLPLPYSKEIKSVMKNIKEEICSPGYTLRSECLSDNLFLNSYGEDLINSKHLTSSIIASKVQRGLFIFHNIQSFSSTQYNHIFQKTYVSDGEWVENVYKLRSLIIYDILHYDFDIIIENNNNNNNNNSNSNSSIKKPNDGISFSVLGSDEDMNNHNKNNFTFDELILKCQSSKIVEWYSRVRDIQNICVSIEDLTNIKSYRESQLLPILLEIIETIYNTVKIKCDYKILRYTYIKPSESMVKEDDDGLLDESKIEMIEDHDSVKQIMSIPDYLIEVEQLESSQSSNDNSNGVFPDIIEGEKLYVIMSDLTDLESLTYISSHVLYSLSEATNKDIPTLLQSSNIPLPILRLCYLGDSNVMHRMICSYIGIRYKCRSYTELVDYRYYVLPYGKNLLAQYLAMTDILYRKLVYCMMQSPDIVPSLEKHEDKPNPEILNIVNPYKLQKYIINSFIRSSRIVTYMKIYLCEGWLNTNNTNSPDVKIPFIMRVELGCSTGAQMQFRETNENFIRHLSDKSFNRSPLLNTPSVIIQYTEVNINGKQISSVQKPAFTYSRIVVANAPIPEDWIYCNVRPSDPWLNLHMIETHPNFSNLINKKDEMGLRNYLIQGGKRCDVGSVIIQSQNPSDVFPILIDDKLFGQFRKIRIVPCILDGHTQEAIPIMHCAEY